MGDGASYQEQARQFEQEIDYPYIPENEVSDWTEEDWKDYLE